MSYERLLIWQYKGKPRAVATAKLISDEIGRAWGGIAQLPEALDIDNAEGANLDLVGKHVGQSRVIPDMVAREFFAFLESLDGGGFQRDGMGGATFYRYGRSLAESVVLDDDNYRFLIRCRITKNYMIGTIPDLLDALDFIFNGAAEVFDGYDMSISVVVETTNVSSFELFAVQHLDILPRPVGVGVAFYVVTGPRPFGFNGSVGGFGFNEGTFARLL
ncbi:conserved hypothetical protein [Paraburkholderia atlantica]|uniref:DUF2612 domain-containing protein n=1 Tax=Paraburkholderia atlantica TaxID=2654982 RepID=D5WMF8_PARAM|nr:DUF2612 domain-containing protein [Paraburkholderia atlantica]ADG20404.1 conserved hypothetical protein [Paraburkholderia atlantica]